MTAPDPDAESLRALAEALPVGVALLDGEGALVFVNAKLEELTGYARSELLGRGIELLLPERLRERHVGFCASYRAAPTARTMGQGREFRAMTKGGAELPVDIGLSRVRGGASPLFAVCVSDRSEADAARRELLEREQALQAMNEILEEKVEEGGAALSAAREGLREGARLLREIEVAREIQKSLLPPSLPRIEGYGLSAMLFPARGLSGDLYDISLSPEGLCYAMLADVAGKGVPAALLGSAARALYMRRASTGESPSAILEGLGAELLDDLERSERIATMIIARLDPATGAAMVANAGGCEIVAFDGPARSCRPLRCGGLPLGVGAALPLDEESLFLRPGSGLVIYSDGITEAEGPVGELFGSDRLAAAICANSRYDADAIASAVMAAVAAFRAGRPVSDDLTLIVIKALPRGFSYEGLCALAALDELPAEVEKASRAYGGPFAGALALAVSEILANIRAHAYGGADGKIALDAKFRTDGACVVIRDWGSPFDPSLVRPPALGELAESGFGLYLARESLDALDYGKGAGYANEWRLEKLIGPA